MYSYTSIICYTINLVSFFSYLKVKTVSENLKMVLKKQNRYNSRSFEEGFYNKKQRPFSSLHIFLLMYLSSEPGLEIICIAMLPKLSQLYNKKNHTPKQSMNNLLKFF